ncbi:hypothetical protein [Terrabacter sp. 2YAF2]|uniref:hypothetical protein n=1 Tax=Terrabacter sp. 2YAF2 TaxID=3233026 RepID=UPI003F9A0B02
MNAFEIAVQSLGAQIVSYIGRDRLASVSIAADELTATAEIAIVLRDQSWAEEERAIDKMVEIRGMFLDDLSFDYRFDSSVELSHTASTRAPQTQFA